MKEVQIVQKTEQSELNHTIFCVGMNNTLSGFLGATCKKEVSGTFTFMQCLHGNAVMLSLDHIMRPKPHVTLNRNFEVVELDVH